MKIGIELNILHSEALKAGKFLQISLKVYVKRQISLNTCRPSKYHVVVQEIISGFTVAWRKSVWAVQLIAGSAIGAFKLFGI